MKLFNAIAAAGVIGASFVMAGAAEEQSKWSKVYPGSQNYIAYVKEMTRRGNTVDYILKVHEKGTINTWTEAKQAHCGDWSTRSRYHSGEWSSWQEMLPETAGGNEVGFVCSNAL